MKALKLILAASVIAASSQAYAQDITANAAITISAQAISVTPNGDMAFPTTASPTLGPENVPSTTPGTFDITGGAGEAFIFTALPEPTPETSCNRASPTTPEERALVQLSTITPAASNATSLDANGTASLSVSGVVVVGAGALTGDWTCTYPVTANYP